MSGKSPRKETKGKPKKEQPKPINAPSATKPKK